MSHIHLIEEYGFCDFIEQKGKCWIWKGNYGRTKKGNKPVGRIKGKGPRRDIRKFLAEKAGLTIRRWTPLKNRCDDFRCVSPTCSIYADDPQWTSERIKQMLDGIERGGRFDCIKPTCGRSRGYCVMKVNGLMKKVTRLLVKETGVKLYTDDEVSHLCDEKDCCNIEHLIPATKSTNRLFAKLQAGSEWKSSIEKAREWHLFHDRCEHRDRWKPWTKDAERHDRNV